jgi:radical SAM protein with 4Fe4S-binding SPASM domain
MKEENDLNKRFRFDFDAPFVSAVETEKIKNFLMKDREPTLVFYGGEPLLQIVRIKELIDALSDVPNIKFRMQTNGKLLDKLDTKHLKKIGKILVSIDGSAERTDFNKGAGTYGKVIENLRGIREQGYDGEIVARMCVSGFSDIYEQVMHLVALTHCASVFDGAHLPDIVLSKRAHPPALKRIFGKISDLQDVKIFDSIHWQLDVGFYSCDYDYETVKKFAADYNAGITKLVDWWVSEMKRGRVWKLYPFIGLTENLLSGTKTKLMCGAGHSNWTITTDGNLVACPIMGCMPDFYCGSLDSDPSELKKIHVGGRCSDCSYLGNCGGRCLYVNKMRLWPPEGLDLICSTVKHLIDTLKEKLPEIRELIKKEIVSEKDFSYEKYFGPEIVP